MRKTVVVYDKASGSEIAWKSFTSILSAERYLKDINRISGLIAKLKVKD